MMRFKLRKSKHVKPDCPEYGPLRGVALMQVSHPTVTSAVTTSRCDMVVRVRAQAVRHLSAHIETMLVQKVCPFHHEVNV